MSAEDSVVAGELMLVVSLDGARTLALRLSDVVRLVQVHPSALETADGREVVRLESRPLPLLRLGRPAGPDDAVHLVMCSHAGQIHALVVERVVAVRMAEAAEPADGPLSRCRVEIEGEWIDVLDLTAALPAPALVTT